MLATQGVRVDRLALDGAFLHLGEGQDGAKQGQQEQAFHAWQYGTVLVRASNYSASVCATSEFMPDSAADAMPW